MNRLRLVLITDGYDDTTGGRVALAAERLAERTDVAIQLRAKALDGRALYVATQQLVKIIDDRVPLVVNDRVDIARAAGAAGAHLPSMGLPTARVRALWPDGIIGRSCHTLADVIAAAAAGASYVVYGPIAPVAAKPHAVPIGMSALAAAARAVTIPVLGLGGLGASDFAACAAAGAGLACISAGLGGALADLAPRLERLLNAIKA